MEHSASRHLRRRQQYARFLVQDLAHQAYSRAAFLGRYRARPNRDAITVDMTDIDRTDNAALADAAHKIAQALQITARATETRGSLTLRRLILRLVLRFAGEPAKTEDLDKILSEATGGAE